MEILSLTAKQGKIFVYQGSSNINNKDVFFTTTVRESVIIDMVVTEVNQLGVIIVSDPITISDAIDVVYSKLEVYHPNISKVDNLVKAVQ